MTSDGGGTGASGGGGVMQLLKDELSSPLNVLLITACLYLAYKLWSRARHQHAAAAAASSASSGGGGQSPAPCLPPLPRQDMTLQQLAQYDGTGADGRVLVAVNKKVFDVTRGSRFYGPGGPYAAFAGKDASRGLATFSVHGVGDQYDDLSDLTLMQMESVREWDAQFTDRYIHVGRLLKPGETAADYTEEDEETEPDNEDGQQQQQKADTDNTASNKKHN